MKWLNVLCVRCLNFSVWGVACAVCHRAAPPRAGRRAARGGRRRPPPTYIYIWLLWDIMSHVA